MKINFGDLFRDKNTPIVYRLDHGFKVGSKFTLTPLGEDPNYVKDEYHWWAMSGPFPVTRKQIEHRFIKLEYSEAAKFLLKEENKWEPNPRNVR